MYASTSTQHGKGVRSRQQGRRHEPLGRAPGGKRTDNRVMVICASITAAATTASWIPGTQCQVLGDNRAANLHRLNGYVEDLELFQVQVPYGPHILQ